LYLLVPFKKALIQALVGSEEEVSKRILANLPLEMVWEIRRANMTPMPHDERARVKAVLAMTILSPSHPQRCPSALFSVLEQAIGVRNATQDYRDWFSSDVLLTALRAKNTVAIVGFAWDPKSRIIQRFDLGPQTAVVQPINPNSVRVFGSANCFKFNIDPTIPSIDVSLDPGITSTQKLLRFEPSFQWQVVGPQDYER
jgi:hypothetical protein